MNQKPDALARLAAVLFVGVVVTVVTNEIRKATGLPAWLAPVAGFAVGGVLHQQLDAPLAQLLAEGGL